MKILISNEAHQDIDSIFEYISRDSTIYANETAKNIYSVIYRLEKSPYIGRYVPEFLNKRYREVVYKSYRIFYEIFSKSNIVYIHFIVHGKRNLKSFYKSYIKNNF